MVAASKWRNFSLNVGSELQTEARCNQEIAREGQRDRMQHQGIKIRRKEQGIGQQWSQRLQHEQFVVQIGAENPDCLDAVLIFPAQVSIQLLDDLAEPPKVIELALSLGAVLGFGIRPGLGTVLAVFVLFFARVLGIGTGVEPVVRHLPVQAPQIFEGVQPKLVGKRIKIGFLTFASSQTSSHRIRQCPPVERVPLGDQRDVTMAVFLDFNAPQSQLVPDRARERLVRGDHSVELDALFAEEIAKASVRGEARRMSCDSFWEHRRIVGGSAVDVELRAARTRASAARPVFAILLDHGLQCGRGLRTENLCLDQRGGCAGRHSGERPAQKLVKLLQRKVAQRVFVEPKQENRAVRQDLSFGLGYEPFEWNDFG